MKKINVVQSYHNCGAPNSCTSKNQNSKPLSLKRHHSQFESPEVEKSDHKKMKKNFENSKRYNNLEISSENFDFMSSISRSEQESTSSDDSDDIQILNRVASSNDEGYGIFCKSIFDDGNINVYFFILFFIFLAKSKLMNRTSNVFSVSFVRQ